MLFIRFLMELLALRLALHLATFTIKFILSMPIAYVEVSSSSGSFVK